MAARPRFRDGMSQQDFINAAVAMDTALEQLRTEKDQLQQAVTNLRAEKDQAVASLTATCPARAWWAQRGHVAPGRGGRVKTNGLIAFTLFIEKSIKFDCA